MSEVSPIQNVTASDDIATDSSETYAEAVRDAAARGVAVVDYGDHCHGLGYPPPEGHVRVRPPVGVMEHAVSDFTVTLAGGTSLADVQAVLREHGQFLPIDGVAPDTTIAEIIAHNLYGPLRLGYGATRELLLGLRIVDGRGTLFRVGGGTMKNVAGYDVTRFMVGNLNTLGLIAEATLRTAAVPQQVTAVDIDNLAPWELDHRMTSLLTTDAMPAHLASRSTRAADGGTRHSLHLGYAGSKLGCDAQYDALVAWLRENLPEAEPARHDISLDEDEQRRQTQRRWQDEAGAWVKLIVPPAQSGQLVQKVLGYLDGEAQLLTLPNWGVIHLGADLDVEAARALDRRLLGTLEAVGGMRVWMRRPEGASATDLPPFAPAQPDWPIISRIRKVFDPDAAINPGRFT